MAATASCNLLRHAPSSHLIRSQLFWSTQAHRPPDSRCYRMIWRIISCVASTVTCERIQRGTLRGAAQGTASTRTVVDCARLHDRATHGRPVHVHPEEP